MTSIRRPVVAVVSMLVLVVIEAILDPTGLLALVGWPGGHLQLQLWWPLAPYVVFTPVLLGVLWWVAVRAGGRFWTMTAGAVLAVLLAQAVTLLALGANLPTAAWGAGYVTAKAVPAALLVAAATRIGARRPKSPLRMWSGSVWPAALLTGGIAPLISGLWWTGAATAPGLPVPRPDQGWWPMVAGAVLLAASAGLSLRFFRRRVPGVLGAWLGILVGGAVFGVVLALVGLFVDDGFAGDLWPLMTAYVHIADGLSFGAVVGWAPALVCVLIDRLAERRSVAPGWVAPSAAGVAILALVVSGLAALYLPSGAAVAAAPRGTLRADDGRITDGYGNTVLLRGVNINQLVDFYQPRADVPATMPLTENDFAEIASYGFDVVRLGISWSALEPQRGSLDQAYLQKIEEAVRWAGDHGIYVVLDMHQDAWSKEPTPAGTACRPGTDPMWGYDGAPAWATIADGTPRCQFTGRDISPAGDRAFQHFFQDTDTVRDALVHTWAALATEFAGNPTIAGYDLLNEPGFGEQAPLTTSQRLGEYQADAIRAIRATGAQQIVFVEPSILWSGLGFDTGPYPGFTDDHNIVFSPHLYAESITMDASLGLPTIVSTERQFDLAQRVAAEYGAPLWSGEYGYWGSPDQIQHHIERYAPAEDAHALGSAYWVWKQACGDPQNGISDISYALVPQDCTTGGEAPRNTALLDVLSRAYPRSAPGRITHLKATGPNLSLTAAGTGCGLDVWVPGTARPTVVDHGIRQLAVAQVPGGWRIIGCTAGEYSLTTS